MALIQGAYNTKTIAPVTKVTTPTTTYKAPATNSTALSQATLAEIQRKASLGIPLTSSTPEKQSIYDSYSKPATITPITAVPQTTVPQTIAPQVNAQDYIDKLTQAQTSAQIAALDKSRSQSLSNLSSERSTIQPYYYDQRNVEASNTAQNARNFAEYMAARGGTNSGVNAQAELTRNMQYQGNLGTLGRQETADYSDIARRTTDVENAYQSDVASATAGNEANRLNLLLNDYYAAQERGDTLAQNAIQNEMNAAGLTGTYQGQPTQSMQSQQWTQNYNNMQLEQSAKQFAEQMGYNWATLSQRDKEYMAEQSQVTSTGSENIGDYQKQLDNMFSASDKVLYINNLQKNGFISEQEALYFIALYGL